MPRRSKEFLRRSKAAKKGWRTRRKRYGPSGRKPKPPVAPPIPPPAGEGITLEVGYDGSDNSFSMTVSINPHNKRLLREENLPELVDLIRDLALKGHFDDSANNPNYDLQWVFFNARPVVVERNVPIKRGHAVLEGFARVAPGTL